MGKNQTTNTSPRKKYSENFKMTRLRLILGLVKNLTSIGCISEIKMIQNNFFYYQKYLSMSPRDSKNFRVPNFFEKIYIKNPKMTR
jgi:hypothetical protein